MTRSSRGEPDLPPGPGRDLVDLFRRLRHGRAITIGQVAVRTGLSRGHVSDVLSGWKAPSPQAARRIAQACHGSRDDVVRAGDLADRLGEINRHHRRQARTGPTPPPVALEPPAAPDPSPVGPPRPDRRPVSGLPRADPYFGGRDAELRAVVDAIHRDTGLCVISGMPGAGKTALAVKAAEMVRDAFPDGVLFIDLHGYSVGQPPLTPAEAIDRLLRRLGVERGAALAEMEEKSALLRDVLADRRLLLVLDNARDGAHVRPLLPSPARGAVVVTSRRRLTALDDAVFVPLDVLDSAAARRLFRSVATDERLTGATDKQVDRVVDLCGRLPLAIRIAAARHRTRGITTLADLVGRLSRAYGRLAELDDDERSAAASFQVSVDDLTEPLRRTFGLVATHPGVDFEADAVAALTDLSRADAERDLRSLADRHLLVEHAADRYRFHDLIGAFARQLAHATVPATDRHAALRRLADYALRATELADRLVTPHRYRVPVTVATEPPALRPLDSYESAFAWLAVEQVNLAEICTACSAAGLDDACWQLAYLLRGYYFLAKAWPAWTTTHLAALAAARRREDPRAEALITNNLGVAYLEQGRHREAERHYEQALRLFEAAADHHGVHTARANLAWVLFAEQRFAEFLEAVTPALEFYRRTGAERNAAITQRGIGLAQAGTDQTAAAGNLRQALEIFTRLGSHLDIAMTWNALGETHQRAGDRPAAIAAFSRALHASERCGSVFEQARAHHRLGELAADRRRFAAAREHWTAAFTGYRSLGAPQARQVAQRLTGLPEE